MYQFKIKTVGYTPLHQHEWEHVVFVLEGFSVVRIKTKDELFKQGDIFFIPPME